MINVVVLLSALAVPGLGQQTCTNLKWPAEATSGFSGYSSSDAVADSGYLMEAAEYHTPDDCTCGVLQKWIFVPQATGAIQFQVWDHINHQSYQLKGENYFTVPAGAVGQQVEFFVPERDRITVRNNYLIGWYGPTAGIIGYKEGDEAYSDEARREPGMGDLDPSNEPLFDWSSGSSVVVRDRIYAFGAEVVSNTAPEFTNLPREVLIYGDETAGAFIYQVQADDIDSKDVASLFIYDVAEDSTSMFYYNRYDRNVYLAVSKPAIGTYTMTFEVQDQCINTNQATLTIQVLNWAPILLNLPSFATLDEKTDNEIALFTIQFSDRDNTTLADSYSINIDPARTDVVAQKFVGHDQTNRTIVAIEGANFAYNREQLYTIDVTLTDGDVTTDKGYFLLYITKNNPPKFTNLENGARANVSYPTTTDGTVVYSVSVTDAENDQLTFTIASCDPSALCPFEIDGDNGVISTTQDFVGSVYEPGWDLTITVTDSTTTIGPRTLTIINEDINDVPQIVNLGLSDPIPVYEGTALGTTIYSLTYIDHDTEDTHSFHATYVPTWATNYFDVNDTTGVLTTAHNILDYEEHDNDWTVVVTFTVHDGLESASGTLTLILRNVNEAPYFHQTKYTLVTPEEGTFGDSANNWNYEMSDPDIAPPDTHMFTWNCGVYTRYFRMDKTTAAVTFATTFDYDNVNFTAPYDCIVTVTDRTGLTATTTLVVYIEDDNDNSPVFANAEYYIFQTPTLDPGRFVGQVTATDKDKTEVNGAIYYSFVSTPFAKNFLLINDYGNIYVNETWTTQHFDYGISHELVVRAENIKDTNGVIRSATVSVTLFLSGTTTTTAVTTDRPFKFIEDRRNVAWLTVAAAAGGVLLIIVCGFTLMYSIQVKRFRWLIPWCRKRVLGLTKMTRREKRRYYLGLLMQEELEDMTDDSDDEVVKSVLYPSQGDSDDETRAPPMLWDNLRAKAPVTRGPTVRKSGEPLVPRAAVYDEPKPPTKKDVSKMMKTSHSKFWM